MSRQAREMSSWMHRLVLRSLFPDGEVYGAPSLARPVSQACTQSQFHEADYAAWCAAIGEAPRLHRKQWEYCYILQALNQAGLLEVGARGLGFGVGREPLSAYFASRGCSVVATDRPLELSIASGWIETHQYAGQLAALNDRGLCPTETFAELVEFRSLDMNAIPEDLRDFDFCWSACALEHLGDLDRGLAFVEQSLDTLRPGGVAVHTTELNCSSDFWTQRDGATVLFRKRDIRRLAARLRSLGHQIILNFDMGAGIADRHIDHPPFADAPHVKLQLGRYVTTSFGMIIRRAGRDNRWTERLVARMRQERDDAELRAAHAAARARDMTERADFLSARLDHDMSRISDMLMHQKRDIAQLREALVAVNKAVEHIGERVAGDIERPVRAGGGAVRADYFDLQKLQTQPRSDNEAEIRALCRATPISQNISLCRVLGRYKSYVDTRDIGIAAHLLLDGFWEMWVTEEMLRHIRPGMTAVDVGANLGYFTLLMADLVGPSGRVLAFEPNPVLADCTRRSIEVNGFLPWTDLHAVGIGEAAGCARLSVRDDNPGGAHIEQVAGTGGGSGIEIDVRRLDSFDAALNADFIKIDVEGFEPYVWRGMSAILDRNRPLTVFMEFNVSRFHDPEGFLNRILGCGFALNIVDYHRGVQSITPEALFSQPRTIDHMLVFRR
jgi:FkbM family methyltransferase